MFSNRRYGLSNNFVMHKLKIFQIGLFRKIDKNLFAYSKSLIFILKIRNKNTYGLL